MDWKKAMERYIYNIPWYYYSVRNRRVFFFSYFYVHIINELFLTKILASTLKHYGIYNNIFPMLNMERYDSWCKQLTKEAEVKFSQMIEENFSNRLVCVIIFYRFRHYEYALIYIFYSL